MAIERVKWEFSICLVMIAIGFCARWSITVHLPPSGDATPCVGTWRRLRASRLHHRCRMIFFVNPARVLGCHESRNPWTPWIPRPCAKHSSTGQDCGPDWMMASLGKQDPRHAELIKKSFVVTGRSVATPGVRDKLDDIEGEVPIGKEAADRYTMCAQ